jgi:hypothetical protein
MHCFNVLPAFQQRTAKVIFPRAYCHQSSYGALLTELHGRALHFVTSHSCSAVGDAPAVINIYHELAR